MVLSQRAVRCEQTNEARDKQPETRQQKCQANRRMRNERRDHQTQCDGRLLRKPQSSGLVYGQEVPSRQDPGFGGARRVLEYIPTGCPAGSLTRPMAPVPFGRLKGNPGASVPPSSFALLQ